uniref:Uncharacterized protein n=1 Tax=mine drainage metagenome TaxID=410659 RepID=E6PWJ1_9ZZZZ
MHETMVGEYELFTYIFPERRIFQV